MSSAVPGGFHEELKRAVERSEKSHAAVAREADLDQSHYAKIRRGGVRLPFPATIKKLARVLEAPELLPYADRQTDEDWRATVEEEILELRRLVDVLAETLEARSGGSESLRG
jgi:transcriptional regulator with XRE-family HTH domain